MYSYETGSEGRRSDDLIKRVYDFGELRACEKEEAGNDVQVLSLGVPGAQGLPKNIAHGVARRANDRSA